MRLDQHLFSQGLAESRQRAQALIMAGKVYLDGQKATKAGQNVPEGAAVEVRGGQLPYVSRGGLKLEKGLKVFPLELEGRVCMDVGASTGGFTDCMLQNGARKVYAVDVGYGQLAWKLRSDERVVVMERTNIRSLQPAALDDTIDVFTIDVSFISLKLVLPVMSVLTGPVAEAICLVKPQFEAGKEKVGKKGVVRDAAIHLETMQSCMGYAVENGFAVAGLDYSPVKGPEGNIEFLMYLRKSETPEPLGEDRARAVCQAAHQELDK